MIQVDARTSVRLGRAAVLAVFAVWGLASACGGRSPRAVPAAAPEPATPSERMLAMLPQGAQVVIEIDLARLRQSPVVGALVTRALSERSAELPAGVPVSPLAEAEQVVLAAYGVGTAQAATLTLLTAPHELAGTTRIAEGVHAVGPPEWIEQTAQRVALATTGEVAFAIRAEPELLELRGHAMPAGAPGASLRITARLSFDARVALARQTGLDAAPARVSAWADIADDFAVIVDCDAADPGNRPVDPRRPSDASRRLEATLRGALAAVAEQPMIRLLGLPSSLGAARMISRGNWVRTIIAVGPAHLRRVVERATAMLGPPAPGAPAAPPPPPAAAPRGDRPS